MSESLTDEQLTVIYRMQRLLRESAGADGRGHISNREIGRALDCSIGQLPDHWEALEKDGVLVREQRGHKGTAYRLLAPGETPPARSRRKTASNAWRRPAAERGAFDIAGQLERLEQMHARGALSDAQFEAAKDALIAVTASRQSGLSDQ